MGSICCRKQEPRLYGYMNGPPYGDVIASPVMVATSPPQAAQQGHFLRAVGPTYGIVSHKPGWYSWESSNDRS